VVVAGETLTPGGSAATIGGNVFSAAPGGSIVVANGNGEAASTIALSQIPAAGGAAQAQVTPPASAILTLGGETVTAVQGSNGGVLIDGTTLPAGQIATIDGQTVSVAAGGNAVVIGQNGLTSTVPLVNPNPNFAVFTLPNGQVVTATSMTGPNGSPIIVVGSVALTQGGAGFTTEGVVLSAGNGGLVMSGAPGSNVEGAIFTIGSSTFTARESVNAQGSTIVVIGSQTVTVGGSPVTLADGEVVSAGTSGLVVIGAGGTSSVAYSAVPAASTPATESASLTSASSPSGSGTGGSGGSQGTASTSTKKKGDAARMGVDIWYSLVAGLLVVVFFPMVLPR
jgi:hypothetical protein